MQFIPSLLGLEVSFKIGFYIKMKFSVVIPLFNKRSSIKRALDSIANQTHLPSEVIIVDDGSTDEGAEVVRGIVTEKFDILLVEQANQGVSSARNVGISRSKNDIVFLLDADDYWDSRHCEHLVKTANLYSNVGFFFSGHCKGNNKNSDVNFSSHEIDIYNHPSLIRAYRKNRNLIHTSAVGFRKSILGSDLFFKVGEKRSEDILLWLSLGLKYDSAFFSSKTSIKTRDYEASQGRAKEIPAHIKFFSKNKDLIPDGYKLEFFYILFRSSILEYVSSARFGVNLAPDLSRTLKPMSFSCYLLFKVLSLIGFHRIIKKLSK